MEENDSQPGPNPDETRAKSTESASTTGRPDGQDGSASLSRRSALATLVAAGGLSVLANPAAAGPKQWQTDVNGNGNTLFDLGALKLIDEPVFGTTDSTALTGVVNDERFLRVVPTATENGPNVFAGHRSNTVSDVAGATIAGGGKKGQSNAVQANYGTVGGGRGNTASDANATVAGGLNNQAGTDDSGAADAKSASVAGGVRNEATDEFAAVGGGRDNEASGRAATVGGGAENEAADTATTVAGGAGNVATGEGATVAGGSGNVANGEGATVAGGTSNVANGVNVSIGGGTDNLATGKRTAVTGGTDNLINGNDSAILGGTSSSITGSNNFAAGRNAEIVGDGNFAWGDSSATAVEVLGSDQFHVQAGGGAFVYSSSDLSTGVSLGPGDGSWASLSARAAKTNVQPVDPGTVLDGVERIEISTWEYDSESDATHMGPMAEEFHAAFELGADETRISNVDADGVALAAIQGLSAKVDEKDERIDDLEAESERKDARIDTQQERLDRLDRENEQLRERLAAVEDRLAALETGGTHRASADD